MYFTFSFGLHTHLLTFFLRLESILVALATSIPKPRATTILRVEVPFDGEVPTWSSIFLQSTRCPRSRWNRQTALEVFSLSFFHPIGTTSILRGVTSTSSEVWTLCRSSSIWAALKFCILTTAAYKKRCGTKYILKLCFFTI